MSKRPLRCAACGTPTDRAKTTFLVDRPGHRGEFEICSGCWKDGPNDEAWDDRITRRIIARREARAVKRAASK